MTDYTKKAKRDAIAVTYGMDGPRMWSTDAETVLDPKRACDTLEARAEAAERERDEAGERANLYDMGVCPNLAHFDLEERIAALEKALEAQYVYEYDGAYKCLLCGGTWGAITNPSGHRRDCLLNAAALEAKP